MAEFGEEVVRHKLQICHYLVSSSLNILLCMIQILRCKIDFPSFSILLEWYLVAFGDEAYVTT